MEGCEGGSKADASSFACGGGSVLRYIALADAGIPRYPFTWNENGNIEFHMHGYRRGHRPHHESTGRQLSGAVAP
jgi:hypothetical protein